MKEFPTIEGYLKVSKKLFDHGFDYSDVFIFASSSDCKLYIDGRKTPIRRKDYLLIKPCKSLQSKKAFAVKIDDTYYIRNSRIDGEYVYFTTDKSVNDYPILSHIGDNILVGEVIKVIKSYK